MDDKGDRIADLIEAAADYLDSHGWCQGASRQLERVCLAEAVARTARQPKYYFPLLADALRVISAHLQAEMGSLPNGLSLKEISGSMDKYALLFWWNDAEGRTAEEVIATLRKVAISQRERVMP